MSKQDKFCINERTLSWVVGCINRGSTVGPSIVPPKALYSVEVRASCEDISGGANGSKRGFNELDDGGLEEFL
eukprot:3933519-Rhodomonas_salina.5